MASDLPPEGEIVLEPCSTRGYCLLQFHTKADKYLPSVSVQMPTPIATLLRDSLRNATRYREALERIEEGECDCRHPDQCNCAARIARTALEGDTDDE